VVWRIAKRRPRSRPSMTIPAFKHSRQRPSQAPRCSQECHPHASRSLRLNGPTTPPHALETFLFENPSCIVPH
jgi:hypothetical protein